MSPPTAAHSSGEASSRAADKQRGKSPAIDTGERRTRSESVQSQRMARQGEASRSGQKGEGLAGDSWEARPSHRWQ